MKLRRRLNESCHGHECHDRTMTGERCGYPSALHRNGSHLDWSGIVDHGHYPCRERTDIAEGKKRDDWCSGKKSDESDVLDALSAVVQGDSPRT
jgi:hypothetical protein